MAKAPSSRRACTWQFRKDAIETTILLSDCKPVPSASTPNIKKNLLRSHIPTYPALIYALALLSRESCCLMVTTRLWSQGFIFIICHNKIYVPCAAGAFAASNPIQPDAPTKRISRPSSHQWNGLGGFTQAIGSFNLLLILKRQHERAAGCYFIIVYQPCIVFVQTIPILP
jgi:hypothetical protein